MNRSKYVTWQHCYQFLQRMAAPLRQAETLSGIKTRPKTSYDASLVGPRCQTFVITLLTDKNSQKNTVSFFFA